MTKNIITNHNIQAAIVDIIKNATKYVFIVTPFFQPWPQLLKAIELASIKNCLIAFIVRSDQDNNEDLKYISEYYNVNVFFVNNLHAKIYLNENTCLISSMNLYNYSKENNFEIGYIMTNKIELKYIVKEIILNEIIAIWINDIWKGKDFNKINEDLTLSEYEISKKYGGSISFCIRCGKNISFNFFKPYCEECFTTWNVFSNKEYVEKYCHKCGNIYETTMSKPLCLSCYSKYNNRLSM